MFEWNEYLEYLLNERSEMDGLTISLNGEVGPTAVPSIIKSSVSLLEKMSDHQGKLNVIVFPEKRETLLTFVLMVLFHSIIAGKVESSYDPKTFNEGDRLKVGNAVVEYQGTEERDNRLYIRIGLADGMRYTAPAEFFPVFQKVETKRRLSKFESYASAIKEVLAEKDGRKSSEKLEYVSSMRTHLTKSVFYMTSIAGAKEMLSHCKLNGKSVRDIFYFAQTNYEGEISNIGSGQMTGNPAIILASDLYAVNAAISRGAQAGAIVIDGSNQNNLIAQLDALDELIGHDLPTVCVTDVANSFELEDLYSRGFNVWRWDSSSITDALVSRKGSLTDYKTGNCAKQSLQYLRTDGEDISVAMKRLSSHRKEVQEQSPQMMKVFEKLNGLTFAALRAIIPFAESNRVQAMRTLSDCRSLLESEAAYLSEKTTDDYAIAINSLAQIYTYGYQIKKEEMLKEHLKNCSSANIYLIIPDHGQKARIQKYWDDWCRWTRSGTTIKVVFPSEYYSLRTSISDETVICGWLKRAIMRKIIYSFNTRKFTVLLYDYEDRWQKYDSAKWAKSLRKSSNKAVVERALSSDAIRISTNRFEQQTVQNDIQETADELGEIELILSENKFRQYVKGATRDGGEAVPAIPVGFVGGFVSFYRIGHKVVSATSIITSTSDNIELKLPGELTEGDFVVVREADKDLIKELADIALKNSGKSNLRQLASKWRESLQIELLFCTTEELYKRLADAGCTKGIATVKRWIDDDDIISPQSKDDLRIIAEVTENETLAEKLDEIFQAAQEVREAHRLAGRKLSEQLRMTLAEELKQFGDIDPFNFWEPIEMEIEGIGTVKVLKIIDVGAAVEVDPADTNRLIEE